MRDKANTTASKPSDAKVFQALLLIGGRLGQRYAYWHRGRYHFEIGAEWSIALSAESAGRLRVDACRHTAVVSSLWTDADDTDRLAVLVVDMREAIGRVAA
jgi:hypothetical protein